MRPEEVLDAFARKHGLGACAYDPDGLCRLVLDSDLCVDLEIQEDGSVLMHCAVGAVNMDDSALLAELLSANLLYTPEKPMVVALDRYRGEVVLLRPFGPDQTPEAFERALDDFAAEVSEWKEGLESPEDSFLAEGEGAAAASGGEPRFSVPPADLFA